MIYAAVLVIHSWLRWLVLLAGIAAFVRAVSGAATGGMDSTDHRAGFWFSIALDVQFLLGLILYVFLSPVTHAAFSDFAGAMKDSCPAILGGRALRRDVHRHSPGPHRPCPGAKNRFASAP